ncbi:hypothetical protein BG006_005676 [Podila minutissima]|uniref:Chitin-binding type-1 domain-containing protein n=1 Tax=Podila minutissima TaxID=64525 RepID=A0A9P5SJL3_9FUNG|nr:hypothetical protein BG006_005676 [Podila minutissima]
MSSGLCQCTGFCGNTPVHCGAGCQVGFGSCNSPSSSDVVSPTSSPTGYTLTMTDSALPPTATTIVTTATLTITTTTEATTSNTVRPISSSTKGTFQLQPTGKPSGASAQDKGVKSTVALVVVFIAGLFMI